MVIESGVTSIGDYAFDACLVMTQVSIPDTVTTIGQYAFSVCDALGQVTIPEGVTTLEAWAFSDCGVTAVSLPSTLTTIGRGAFNSAYNLTSIVIPERVTEIPDSAFYDCYQLTGVVLPDSITRIGNHAFSNCPLTSLELPDGLTYIGDDAFWNAQMTSVTIPAGVTYLGYCAFLGCTALETITFTGDAPAFGEYVDADGSTYCVVFSNVTATAYYPTGNPTWTADVLQNYGGDITWVPYELEADEDGHVWDEGVITTEPTCTEDGIITYTCEHCGETMTETIPATGHTPGDEWESDEDGHWRRCTVCGEAYDNEDHTFDWVTDTEATATADGSRHEECTVCGRHGDTEVIPATGITDTGDSDATGNTGDGQATDDQTNTGSETATNESKAESTTTDQAPETGDESNVILYAAVLMLSLAALTAIIVYSAKPDKPEYS